MRTWTEASGGDTRDPLRSPLSLRAVTAARAERERERARETKGKGAQKGLGRTRLRGTSAAMSSQPSPATRFNLKNILGSSPPTMNQGRRVPNGGAMRETCCLCFELRAGVITIACVYIVLYLINVANMVFDSLGWQMRSKAWQGFDIFCVVVGLPLCLVGLLGAIKKRPKLVYAYFLFNVVYSLMALLASIALCAQIAQGKVSEDFMENTGTNSRIKLFKKAKYISSKCGFLRKDRVSQAREEVTCNPVSPPFS